MSDASLDDDAPRWDLIAAERRALADLVDGLDDAQLETQSLCGRWTVRQVVAHTMVGPTASVLSFGGAMLRGRGNFDRANDLLARDRAKLPLDRLVGDLRERAESHFTPPTFDWHAPLTDLLVHHADVAVPLGLPLDRPLEAWSHALPFLVSRKARGAFTPRELPDLTFAATDLDWSHGTGPVVSGPAAALGVAMCGRAAVLEHLDGPGRDQLAAWLRR